MKASRYNHFFKEENGIVMAYNAFSNSFATINEEQYNMIMAIFNNNGNVPAETDKRAEMEALRADLIRGGYLIDEAIDEFEILKAQSRIARFSTDILALTIAPTLKCNFKCVYCFEDPKKDTIDAALEEKLIKFVEQKLDGKKAFQLSWFGGEPLIELNTIERLVRAFEKLCKEKKVSMQPGSIITNGYLLSKEVAEKLKNVHIGHAQITLDGIPEIHDKRRMLKNGAGTFAKIIANIKSASRFMGISVRINVDKSNMERLDEFYQLWAEEKLSEHASFYLSPVFESEGGCADIAGQCLAAEEFAAFIARETEKAKTMGIAKVHYPALSKSGYCMADKLAGFVVAPSGLIFKCWEQIANDAGQAIGDLNADPSTPTPKNIMNETAFLNWDAFEQENCKSCNVLPICGGGCVLRGIRGTDKANVCSTYKYNLANMLKLKYQYSLK